MWLSGRSSNSSPSARAMHRSSGIVFPCVVYLLVSLFVICPFLFFHRPVPNVCGNLIHPPRLRSISYRRRRYVKCLLRNRYRTTNTRPFKGNGRRYSDRRRRRRPPLRPPYPTVGHGRRKRRRHRPRRRRTKGKGLLRGLITRIPIAHDGHLPRGLNRNLTMVPLYQGPATTLAKRVANILCLLVRRGNFKRVVGAFTTVRRNRLRFAIRATRDLSVHRHVAGRIVARHRAKASGNDQRTRLNVPRARGNVISFLASNVRRNRIVIRILNAPINLRGLSFQVNRRIIGVARVVMESSVIHVRRRDSIVIVTSNDRNNVREFKLNTFLGVRFGRTSEGRDRKDINFKLRAIQGSGHVGAINKVVLLRA